MIEQSMDADRENLIRQYAAGEITWHALRERGFEDYVQVLAGLGELGLRPPIAPMTGPNVAARQRGIALLQRLLQNPPRP
jgi:hypothetical protein